MRNISEDLDPPVVIVGTGKDAVTSKSALVNAIPNTHNS